MNGDGVNCSADKKDGKSTMGGAEEGDYVILDDRNINSKPATTRGRVALDNVAAPWLVWTTFFISIAVGASGPAVTVSMPRAAPISLAGWRHQISALILLPGFIYERIRLPKQDRQKTLTPRILGLHFLSALAISSHFGTLIWALSHTSMTHCLFLSCMSPIFVVLYTKLVGGVLLRGEIVGVIVGVAGVAILGAGTKVEQDNMSTSLGDFVSLCAGASTAIYLIVGKNLRSWMPLFVYQFPIALFASIILGVTGLLLEGWNESDTGHISGPFSWVRKEYILGTIFLGAGPGVIGHLGYNFVLKYSSPLVMPTGLSLQPVIGSAIGWAAGESPTPGLWTCIGGAVTLSGTLHVSCASAHRKEELGTKEEDYEHLAADEEGQQETKTLLQRSEISDGIDEPLLPEKSRS